MIAKLQNLWDDSTFSALKIKVEFQCVFILLSHFSTLHIICYCYILSFVFCYFLFQQSLSSPQYMRFLISQSEYAQTTLQMMAYTIWQLLKHVNLLWSLSASSTMLSCRVVSIYKSEILDVKCDGNCHSAMRIGFILISHLEYRQIWSFFHVQRTHSYVRHRSPARLIKRYMLH